MFNERMRVNKESSSEIQSEAVVLKDLTKVCCIVKLRQNICIHQILHTSRCLQTSSPASYRLTCNDSPKYLCPNSDIVSSFIPLGKILLLR